MTHICVVELAIIGSDNGLSPGRRQAIIWTNAGLSLIRPLGTNFSEILIEILLFSFKKMRLKVSSAKRRPFCLGLNVLLKTWNYYEYHENMYIQFNMKTVWYDHQPYDQTAAFNSFWTSANIWQHTTESTLAQAMAYINQCWLIINGVLWCSPNTNFTGSAHIII